MSKKHSHSQQKKKHFSTKHTIVYFLVYTLLIFMILALINFMIFPELMYIFSLLGVSIVLGAIATYLHSRRGTRDGVDSIADEIAR